ncbi:hypothetical protein GE21DRAFT_1197971, partial [Neurospora crassa]
LLSKPRVFLVLGKATLDLTPRRVIWSHRMLPALISIGWFYRVAYRCHPNLK